MILRNLLIITILSCLIFSCKSEKEIELKSTSLLQYGMPLSILAPDSVTVKKEDMVIYKGLTVEKGKDYSLQIWESSPPSSSNVTDIKAARMAEVTKKKDFSAIVKEDDNGFVYETVLDSTRHNYDFRYIKIMGDKEYLFQGSMIGVFTKEQAEKMYESVQVK